MRARGTCISCVNQTAEQGQAGFARMLAVAGCGIGDHDDVGANGGIDGLGRRQPRAKPINGGRLLDVERLPARHRHRGIDEADLRDPVARRERVCDRAAERAASDDGLSSTSASSW